MSETPPTSPAGATPPLHRAPPPRRRPAWRTLAWIVAAILVFIVAGCLLTPHGQKQGHGRGGAGGANGRGGPTAVGLATAQRGDIPITLQALGTVTSEATITVQSQISGTLEKVDFTEGQVVRKGQLLAEVDARPYEVALAQAQGQLAKDQAALANAELDLKRYRTLAAQDSIAAQQVDTQAALVKQDEGLVKTDQAGIASAKLNLVYCHIIAPVSGRVGLRQVDAGNYITPSETNGLVVITQVDPIDIVFSLPEDDIPQIAARTAQGATLTVTALDRTGAITLGQGLLSTLDNQVDTSTGTIKAKARFANPKGTLFPNQFVNVTLLVDTLHDAITVPTAAVRHGANGDFVFVLDQDPLTGGDIARMATVKVGPSQGDTSSIASGLQVGEQVITDGGDRLADGAPVVLPGQAPPAYSRPAKTGFFGWLAGLFGHKPPAGDNLSGGGAAATGGAAASAAGASNGGGRGGAARMQAMLGQLGLTPDQKAKVGAITADMRQKVQAAGDDPDARRAAMRAGMAQVSAVLTPEQKTKLASLRAAVRAGGGAEQAPPIQAPPPAASSAAPSPAEPARTAAPSPAPDQAQAPAPPTDNAAPAGGGPGGGR
ncbi:MAG: MdtA/MuxA family multidrug efflux RND transporter periplasmic adaptor subunit, partial [Caulobacteraceae bacterium]|nr:MdtA/MuxA family multidrug efflux RND transporter periplasmic adaptor subunit [Caulobacteraceae bacterium]